MSKYTIKSIDKAALKEYDQKSALYQTMHENKSFNKNPANHALYHALMEAVTEDENAMDKGVTDTVKNQKRQHDDEDPSAGPNQALSLPQVTPTISIVQQTTTPIPTPLITIEAPTITTDVLESDALTAVQLRVAKLEKDVFELKKIDHSIEALASLKSQVPTVIGYYLGSKIGDDLQKVLQRHTADLIQKYSVKPAPESSKIQSPTVDPEQEYEKSALEIRKAKKELSEKKKMSKYTIKSTDKAALKEYD
ncbi:hypothetical protein Tco_0941937 [Tanacetum coccineum]|uniref:Uncharacterized protein n=1 Tax=Tanacetum coccineum TaxID=301880 RepID=A0ABQ5DSC8_9ASTR